MLYELCSLSKEDLKHLYDIETNKLVIAYDLKFPHNDLQAIKLNLKGIELELRQKVTLNYI